MPIDIDVLDIGCYLGGLVNQLLWESEWQRREIFGMQGWY